MQHAFIVSVTLFLLSLYSPTFAQNNGLAVLDPHQILSSTVQTVEQLPVININDVKHTLDYFDPKTMNWTTYKYPDELKEIKSATYNIRKRSDGTYLISPEGFSTDFVQSFVPKRWIFNPANGTFSLLKSVCINHAQSLPEEGEWVIVDGEGSSHLCNTATEAISPPIPSVQMDGYCENYSTTQHSAISPDKTYLLFFCGGRQLSAFSYHIQKQIFRYLGDGVSDSDDNISVVRWLNNNEAIIHSFPAPNPPRNSYYTVDVSTKNSLQFIAADVYLNPFYFDNPPHLEWMPCEFGMCGGPSNDPSGLHYYDFVAHKLTVLPDLPAIKGESSLIPDGSGDRLYRELNNTSENVGFNYTAPSATLIRFNYETQKQEAIFSGEIEWIEGFSANGRYVALQIGEDNQVPSSALLADNQAHYTPHGQAEIDILDLHTHKIVYTVTGNEWDEFSGDNPMPFSWLDDKTFLVQSVNGKSDQIIQLQPNTQILAEFPAKSTTPSANNQLVLVNKDKGLLGVYDVLRNHFIPVIEQPVDPSLRVNSTWNNVNSLLLTISQDDIVLAKWVISIN